MHAFILTPLAIEFLFDYTIRPECCAHLVFQRIADNRNSLHIRQNQRVFSGFVSDLCREPGSSLTGTVPFSHLLTISIAHKYERKASSPAESLTIGFLLCRNSLRSFLCREPGSNRRPLPLQGNALPTELSRQVTNKMRISYILIFFERCRDSPIYLGKMVTQGLYQIIPLLSNAHYGLLMSGLLRRSEIVPIPSPALPVSESTRLRRV